MCLNVKYVQLMLINVRDLSICNLEGFIAIIQYHPIQERGKDDLNRL